MCNRWSLRLSFCLTIAVSVPGCGKGSSGSHDGGPDDTDSLDNNDPGGGNSDYVFDDSVIRTFEVEIDPVDWLWLQEHAIEEEYVPATVYYNGLEFYLAAIRFKGGNGSLINCLNGTWLDLLGRDCDKLNMKIKFSEYDNDRRFFGLERINLHGMDKDYSRIREMMAYRAFRDYGVPASRAAYAELVINGQPRGLHLAVEQVDGQFARYRFEDGGTGNLYKENWFNVTNEWAWLDALKTNLEENPDVTGMIDLADELNACSPAEFRDVVDSWMYVDQLVRYVAVEQVIGHWDGIMAWYCGKSGCNNHNYFVYEYTDRQKVALIAWDLDLTMSTFGVPNLLTDLCGLAEWHEVEVDCTPVEEGWCNARPASCDDFLSKFGVTMWNDYIESMVQFLGEGFAEATVEEQIDQYSALIAESVAKDAFGPTATEWEDEVAELRVELGDLRELAWQKIGY